MEGFLALGFLMGMQHALEADHLVAVGSMALGAPASKRRLALRGAVWGVGHTLTLFAICAAVILLGLTLTDRVAAALEFGVGVMLVLLGLDVIRRIRARRIHFHAHRHGDGRAHLHAHSHAGATAPHGRDPHRHGHPEGFPLRALLVGLMHGAAGSAGLLALAVAATREPWVAVGYVLLFGLGSILGMATLSFVVAWPLGAAAVAIFLGVEVMSQTAAMAWAGL